MLILLSPAKKLLPFSQPYTKATSHPVFEKKTDELIKVMKTKTMPEIAQLMNLSCDLATLNYQRYQTFCVGKSPAHLSYPAIFLFQGDVYQSLKAQFWDEKTLNYAQSHCAILSGLYGLLRPLDAIMPYRLEMGTRLKTEFGSNLYQFWGSLITEEINKRLATLKKPFLINLASTEYFSAVHPQKLTAPLLTIHFLEKKNNQLKVVGIQAKKARGAMASYILQHEIEDPEELMAFNLLGYEFCKQSSGETHFNFIREG